MILRRQFHGGWRRVKAAARRVPLLFAAYQWLSLRERSQVRLQKMRPDGLFQPFSTTFDNRYPGLFAFVRDRLAGCHAVRILSFGCSTGQEVFSLRRYFPQARLVGLDINPYCIRKGNAKLAKMGDPAISFHVAGSAADWPDCHFDAIFAMAVFRHGHLKTAAHCDPLITFDGFQAAVAQLDRCLRPGGYLIIQHSNFRFMDTVLGALYRPVLTLDVPETQAVFGADNARLPHQAAMDVIFQKIQNPSGV